ncbi:11485_t:CDS:2 [Ambispora gerdemannii]|uniref:11485_t:CDS:1 n=1 Tax=Ambispora gerdemannii TaxID=144530 RepID=A0A9N8W2J2_9GLOM|nr:11485_t:CDS:2 [Ambispora gerdemannii]
MEIRSSKKSYEDDKEEKESGVLKRLIKELSDNIPETFKEKDNENSSDKSQPHNFLYLFTLKNQCKELKQTHNSGASSAILNSELRDQIPKKLQRRLFVKELKKPGKFMFFDAVEGDKLSPVDDAKEHFDKPAKKHIHVIVELPASFGEFVRDSHEENKELESTKSRCCSSSVKWTLRDSSKANLENTSTIIPAAKRVKLDTLLPNKIIGEEDDIARMEDVYDVMSKEEIWRHKIRIASEIVRNIPSFSSMYA